MTKDVEEEKLSRSDKIALRISVIQTVLAVSGLFLGAIALYAALSQADAARKQVEASVWPRLNFDRTFNGLNGANSIRFFIYNAGIGPGEIRSVRATLDGHPVLSSKAIAKEVTGSPQFIGSNGSLAGMVLRAGEDATILSVNDELSRKYNSPKLLSTPLRDAFDSGRLKFEICYCSVFERCWIQKSTQLRPTPTDKCPNFGEDAYTY